MRLQSNARKRNSATFLLVWLLITAVGVADRNSTSPEEPEFDRPVLTNSAYRVPAQQRQLLVARQEIRDGNYSAAFQHLRDLLGQPFDSTLTDAAQSPMIGIRAAVLQELVHLPPDARRSWEQFREGPARAALLKALQQRSRTALVRVATEFPCSAAAADALITEAVWAVHAHEARSAQVILKRLRQWEAIGVLSRSQIRSVNRLAVILEHSRLSTAGQPERPRSDVAKRLLQREPAWTWQESIWRHSEWPDVMPIHHSGTWHNDLTRWQFPILSDDTIVIRTPAGIACLNRDTGSEHWFLPLRSDSRKRLNEGSDSRSVFDIAPATDQRLEAADGIVWFIDGRPVAPVQSPGTFRSSIVLEHGATHLVAVRSGPRPAVLWQLSGYDQTFMDLPTSTLAEPPVSEYTFRLPEVSSRAGSNDVRPAPDAQHHPSLQGHLFLSAPRVHAGRLYITSQHDGVTWLNCLTASKGHLIWQQPLTWYDGVSQSAAVVGAVGNDTVVCLFASGLIAGCSTVDGQIHWLQSVLLANENEPEPDDFRLTEQADSRIIPQSGAGGTFGEMWLQNTSAGIVCGRRGSAVLCSLDESTGERQWSVPRCAQGSTADQQSDLMCLGQVGQHLIMMGYGHCRAIDAATGSQVWVRPLSAHSGRVCCSESVIYAALNNGRLLTIDATDGSIQQSQPIQVEHSGPALVADAVGLTEASAWRLRSWDWADEADSPQPDQNPPVLRQLIAHRLRELGDPVPQISSQQPLTADECRELAGRTALSPQDQLRFALAAPTTNNHRNLLMKELQTDPHQLVRLLPGWNMPLLRAIRTLDLLSSFPDQAEVAETELFPEQLGSFENQIDEVNRLLNNSRHKEAELMLLNMRPHRESNQAERREELLVKVRSGTLTPGRSRVEPAGPVKVSFRTEASETDGFRLNDIETSGRRSLLRREGASVPSWSSTLFIADPGPLIPREYGTNRVAHLKDIPSQAAHVASVDVQRGIKSAWALSRQIGFPQNVSWQDHWEMPGLVIVRRGSQIGVTSLLSDNPLEPLWLHPVPDHRSGQVLLINSRQLVVCSNFGIQSFHPLTGQLQWSHIWKDSEQLHQLEGQYLKVYSTDSHLILLPSLGTGFVVLRADDGLVLREGVRPSGELSHVVDGYLLTSGAHQQLNILHLPSGRQVPVEPGDHRVVTFHPAGELGRRKATVITDAPEFCILDVASGRVESRIPIEQGLRDVTRSLMGPRMFRRSGLLMVSLGSRTWHPPYIPEDVFGERVTGNGTILCLDPETGEPLWQQDQHPTVMPVVFGDPCPFVVQWSTRFSNVGPHFRISSRHQRTSLEISILDAFTGKTVGRTVQNMAARPLQVIHDADQQQLRITTEHSTILVDYQARR